MCMSVCVRAKERKKTTRERARGNRKDTREKEANTLEFMRALRHVILAVDLALATCQTSKNVERVSTLELRMRNHESAGLEIANWFSTQSQVDTVLHPALADCPGHEFWVRDFCGASGLFSVLFKQGDPQKLERFTDSLQMFGLGVSWGGFESLALPICPKQVRTAKPWEATGSLVRFSIGNENRQDLIADLTQAMTHLE